MIFSDDQINEKSYLRRSINEENVQENFENILENKKTDTSNQKKKELEISKIKYDGSRIAFSKIISLYPF